MLRRQRESEDEGQRTRIPLPIHELDFRGDRFSRPIRLPKEVSEKLAENVGIHISDGHMRNKEDGRWVSYGGHAIDDFPYYTFRFVPLLKELWQTSRISYKGIKGEQSLKIKICSKRLVLFKEKVLGLPSGRKEGITIPDYFLGDRRITCTVLRGLFDGDGSLTFKSKDGLAHTYPVLSYSSTSQQLMKQLQWQLQRLGFVIPTKLWERENGTFYMAINGDINYELWMNVIGFNNPKHLTKVVLYETFGFVPPETDLVERVKLIQGKIKLSEIYPVDKLRVNNNRITEKQVLKILVEGENYIAKIGRQTKLEPNCVAKALRRLLKKELVVCDEEKSRWKKYYRITQWGVNKLNRVNEIVKWLREEFYLAV